MAGAYLGIDIGTTSIKAVEVRGGKNKPSVTNYGLLESSGYLARANQALQTSGLKLFESGTADLLTTLIGQMGTKTTDAVASLAPFSVFSVALDFPRMEPKEITQAMTYQAKQYVPQPLAEVALDWLKVAEFTDDRGVYHQKVLLVAVPKEQIQKYQRVFRTAGLTLRALEIESLSIARIFGDDPTPTVVVDIGSRSTNIVFLEGGVFLWSAQSDFASASLTQALAESLSINPLRAEELKKERGIAGTGPSRELSTIILPIVDAIINEVKKAQYTFAEQFPSAKKAERMLLSGGGANLLGIEPYFEREFGTPVFKAAPFNRFEYDSAIAPLAAELNPMMSVALGLGIKEFLK